MEVCVARVRRIFSHFECRTPSSTHANEDGDAASRKNEKKRETQTKYEERIAHKDKSEANECGGFFRWGVSGVVGS